MTDSPGSDEGPSKDETLSEVNAGHQSTYEHLEGEHPRLPDQEASASIREDEDKGIEEGNSLEADLPHGPSSDGTVEEARDDSLSQNFPEEGRKEDEAVEKEYGERWDQIYAQWKRWDAVAKGISRIWEEGAGTFSLPLERLLDLVSDSASRVKSVELVGKLLARSLEPNYRIPQDQAFPVRLYLPQLPPKSHVNGNETEWVSQTLASRRAARWENLDQGKMSVGTRQRSVIGFLKGQVAASLDGLKRLTAQLYEESESTGLSEQMAHMLMSLEEFGFARIDTSRGADFDPTKHQAFGLEPDDQLDENQIKQVLADGYELALEGETYHLQNVSVVLVQNGREATQE